MSIKLENVVLASPEQMEFIIEGMRNPMNSWDKSDSHLCNEDSCDECCFKDRTFSCSSVDINPIDSDYMVGKNDYSLMQHLAKAGTDHRKFMRMLPVYVRITAPLYWWKEFDTYKVGTVANSCSTMHKIQAKEFVDADFSYEHMTPRSIALLEGIISELNDLREYYLKWDKLDDNTKNAHRWYEKKDIWWQMIQLLPSSYNQTRNVMMNYEVLANIYKSRKDHKQDEWRNFCKWIEELPYSELITDIEAKDPASIDNSKLSQTFNGNEKYFGTGGYTIETQREIESIINPQRRSIIAK